MARSYFGIRTYGQSRGVSGNQIFPSYDYGILVEELPPIVIPAKRIETIEIDGKDGDETIDLGYAAYDRPVKMALTSNDDATINRVYDYLIGQGYNQIVFSNQPEKIQYFKINNEIELERLLRYKRGTINFHCQPSKYYYGSDYLDTQQYTDVQRLVNSETTIRNSGGILSKPIYEIRVPSITGATREVIVDGATAITVGKPSGVGAATVIINTETQTATMTYSGLDSPINANRYITGTLSKLWLSVGSHVISGVYTIQYYNRWIV